MSTSELELSAGAEPRSLGYSWYIVFLCMVAYIFSFLDRQVISLLVEPIRADLQISDTQFSLVHGLAFALFYAAMGIPLARIADSRSRPLLIAWGIAIWCLATAACGLAKNFVQLFLARMAVGFGEAALSPAAYSMISDSFPKSKLGLALGVYSIGSFIGAGLAFIIGGTAIAYMDQIGAVTLPVVGVVKPWQMTFFIVGLPGLLVALLFVLTVRDPQRKGLTSDKPFTIGQVLGYIKTHKRAFSAHYLGFSLLSLPLFALMSWSPAFLLRNYDLTTKETGLYLGVVTLLANTAGVLSSGWLTDYFTRRGRDDAAFRAAIVGGLGVVAPALLFPHIGALHLMLPVFALAMYFASFPMATSAAALQNMAPNRMRAQVTALFFVGMNILGITGGASLVALLTDYVFESEPAVGYSMSIVASAAALIAAPLLCWGLKHYRHTVRGLAQ